MQCHAGNREKRIAKCGVKLLKLKLGKKSSQDSIHKYLQSCGSAIKELDDIIIKAGNSIEPKYQRNRIIEYGELGLWLALNHPKIRPVMIKALNEISVYTISKEDLNKVQMTLIEQKVMMKALKYTASKMMQGRYTNMRVDLLSSSNQVVSYLFEELNAAVQSIVGLSDDEKASIIVMLDCGLWTMSRDTAYRDVFFWSLSNVCSFHITTLLSKHPLQLVKEPKQWYPNVWWRGKKRTQQMREQGDLNPGEFSESDKYCVPNIANKIINKGR